MGVAMTAPRDPHLLKSFGHTVWHCQFCGFQAWGRPVTTHPLFCQGAHVIPLGFQVFDRFTETWKWVDSAAKAAYNGV